MGLETNVQTIRDLKPIWPPIGDPRAQGADHLRNIKTAIQGTFPNLTTFPLTDAQVTAVEKVVGKGDGSDLDYVQKSSSSADFRVSWAGVNRASGSPFFSYLDDRGVKQITWFQPKGDYVTSAALKQEAMWRDDADKVLQGNINSEASSRASADANLQNQVNNRVVKTGDTMTGTLAIDGDTGGFIAQYNPSSPTSGSWINYPGFSSIAKGRGGEFHCQLQEQVGNTFRALMSLRNGGNSWRYVKWGGSERINDSQYGDVAYMSDLPNMGGYASKADLPLDAGKVILAWSGYVGGGDQTIPFPRGLSSVDVVLVCCSRQISPNYASAICNVQSWDNISVKVNSAWVGGSSQGNADVYYHAVAIGRK